MRDVRNLLLAVDPGTRGNTGCALFDRVSLTYAAVVKEMKDIPYCQVLLPCSGSVRAVIEVPRWYPREHKIDVNDLIELALWAGKIAGILEHRGFKVEYVYPRTWKGTVPKAIHNKRVLAALIDEERALLPRRPRAKDVDHNLLDAVGIGLWKLGRM